MTQLTVLSGQKVIFGLITILCVMNLVSIAALYYLSHAEYCLVKVKSHYSVCHAHHLLWGSK